MSFTRFLRRLGRDTRGNRKARPRYRPRLDVLEDRTAPAVLTVNTPDDETTRDGSLSLREAIQVVNQPSLYETLTGAEQGQIFTGANPLGTNDTILFDSSLNGQTITLGGQELLISKNLNIIGPGAGNLTIDGNRANRIFENGNPFGTVLIAGLTITNGKTFGGGGISNNGTLTVANCTLASNTAVVSTEGGGIANDGTLTVTNCTFSGNSADAGGAIWSDGYLTVVSSTFSSNTASASGGGGIFNLPFRGQAATVANCTFSGNRSNGVGGGIWNIFNGGFGNSPGPMTVANCTFSGNNFANSGGGGIDNSLGGILTVTNSTLASNSTFGVGGGIKNDATLKVINSTLFDNSATSGGGGIANSGALKVTNCTLSQNDGGTAVGGGGIYNAAALTIGNTIVAKNVAGTGLPQDVSGVATSQGYNLIGDGSGSSGFGVAGDQVGSANSPIDPFLGPLQDNGGPTPTMALLPGSPAIDAGSDALAVDQNGIPLGFDQRGFQRVANGTVDIGAFEVQVYLVYNTFDSGGGSLRSAVTNAGRAGGSVIAFTTSGTINLASALPDITRSVQILGPGANDLTVQRSTAPGTPSFGIFTVDAPTSNIPDIEVILSGLTIANGNSLYGGGISNQAILAASNCVLTGNSAVNDGGGLYSKGGSFLLDCSLTNNTASRGGGIAESGGTVFAIRCTLADNSAVRGGGGGLYNEGFAFLAECTLSRNTAAALDTAGGIDTSSTSMDVETVLSECTVAGNTNLVANGPGGLFAGREGTGKATVLLDDTIVANNTGTQFGTANAKVGPGAFFSNGYNLSSDTSGSLAGPGDLQGVKPLLAPLGNYGGPTPTMALLPGSPAINAGNPDPTDLPAIDQRGFARIVNGRVDIGAFESRGFTIAVAGGNGQQAIVNTLFAAPLTVQVSSPFGEPVQNGVVTFTAPGNGASATFPGNPTANIDASGQASIPVGANGSPGTYGVTASANGAAGSATFTLTNLSAITIFPPSLPHATAGIPYNQSLSAIGGAGFTYTFAVTAGALPQGFTLSSSGVLSGRSTKAGTTSFTVTATDGIGFTGSLAFNFTVDPAPASQLVVTIQPSSTATAGVAFATQPVVQEEDPFGNVIASDSTHTIAASRGTGTAALQGTTTITLANGVGAFTNLSYNVAETMNVVFTSNASGVSSATSNNVVVSPAAASQLVIAQEPSGTATAGVTFATQPVVKEEDAFGNVIGSDSTHTVTAARGSLGSATLQGTTTLTLVNGVASFGNLFYTKAETMNLLFTTNAGGVSPAASTAIVVNPNVATQFLLSGPSSVTSGTAFNLTVTAVDAYGNVATGYPGTVKFASTDNSATLPGKYTFTASDNGVHTFTGLVLKKKGTQTGTQTITVFDSVDNIVSKIIINVL
jgi:hypothetical protein